MWGDRGSIVGLAAAICGAKASAIWRGVVGLASSFTEFTETQKWRSCQNGLPYKLHFSCLSDAVFERGVRIEMSNVPGPFGPVRLVFSTKYPAGGDLILPLSIEAEGLNLDEITATQSFADLIRGFLRSIAVTANAPVHELQLAEDLPAPAQNRARRVLDLETTNGVLRAFYDCPARAWVGRAAQDYETALRHAGRARETLMLAHLFQACLSLKEGLVGLLCQRYRCQLAELPKKVGLRPDELDGYIYRNRIFQGRTDLFRIAYDANARLFSLQHPQDCALWQQQPFQQASVREVAVVVRATLLDLAEVDASSLPKLTSEIYKYPVALGDDLRSLEGEAREDPSRRSAI